MQSDSDDPVSQRRLAAFRSRMHELGWDDGHNVRININWGRDPDKLTTEAQQLVGLQPQVILATNTVTAQILRRQTGVVPIVFAGASDPLASGLVANLAHPSGNVTGFSNFEFSLGAKWRELLKQAAPNVNRVAVLMQPNNDGNRGLMGAIEIAAHAVSIQLSAIDENDTAAVQRELPTFASESDGGLIVLPNPSVTRDLIIALASRYKMPGVYPARDMARAGGLLSYDIEAATYADRILKGEKLGNLPVQAPAKFHLLVNLRTAKAFGLTMPSSLLASADEVIE